MADPKYKVIINIVDYDQGGYGHYQTRLQLDYLTNSWSYNLTNEGITITAVSPSSKEKDNG